MLTQIHVCHDILDENAVMQSQQALQAVTFRSICDKNNIRFLVPPVC